MVAMPPPPVAWSPKHYGICLAEEFADFKHQGLEMYEDAFDGRAMVRGCVQWLIALNTPLPHSEPLVAAQAFTRKFKVKGSRAFRLRLVKCSLERPPSRLPDIDSRMFSPPGSPRSTSIGEGLDLLTSLSFLSTAKRVGTCVV